MLLVRVPGRAAVESTLPHACIVTRPAISHCTAWSYCFRFKASLGLSFTGPQLANFYYILVDIGQLLFKLFTGP
jgi:hypothetical protein